MCTFTHSPTHQGYTVRVESWRYTAWIQFNGTTNRGKWGDVGSTAGWLVGEELYSHDDSTQVDDFDVVWSESSFEAVQMKLLDSFVFGFGFSCQVRAN